MPQGFDENKCFVCQKERARTISNAGDWHEMRCPRCGEFRLTGSTAPTIRELNTRQRVQLSGWIRGQVRSGAKAEITTNNIDTLINRPLPPIWERAESLLLEAEREVESLGDPFNPNSPRYSAASYASSCNDLRYLTQMLVEEGMIQVSSGVNENCSILPKGYVRLEELHGAKTDSSQGFVAMSFNEGMDSFYESGIEPALSKAGYRPLRVDRHDHINKIDDEIVRQINASRFIVADFTEHRGGVYFEAGYALGKGIPIFWTCRQDHMDQLHFDIRQFNCIDWSDPQDLAKRLQTRVEAVLGKGPAKSFD